MPDIFLADDLPARLLHWPHLQAMGIANTRAQLRRLQTREGFPRGFWLSATTRVWDTEEVRAWLDARRRASEAA